MAPDWDKGLPTGVLSLVAGGRNELKAMRGVSCNWKDEFEGSVSKITTGEGPQLPTASLLSSRFPGLTSLLLWKHKMGLDSLRSFSSLRKVAQLSLILEPSEEHFMDPQQELQSIFEEWWSDDDLEALKDFPALADLTLNSYQVSGLQNLRGTNLTRLDLIYCMSISDLDGIQGLPLASIRLETAPVLTDAGLESLRGMCLTDLDLYGCPGVTGVGLEVFQGMPLRRLSLEYCRGLTPAACAHLLRGLHQLTQLILDGCCEGMMDKCLEVSKFTVS